MTASASGTSVRIERALGALTVWHGALVVGFALWAFASVIPDLVETSRGSARLVFGPILLIGVAFLTAGVLTLRGVRWAWVGGFFAALALIVGALMIPMPLAPSVVLGLSGTAGVLLSAWRMHRVGADARLAGTRE